MHVLLIAALSSQVTCVRTRFSRAARHAGLADTHRLTLAHRVQAVRGPLESDRPVHPTSLYRPGTRPALPHPLDAKNRATALVTVANALSEAASDKHRTSLLKPDAAAALLSAVAQANDHLALRDEALRQLASHPDLFVHLVGCSSKVHLPDPAPALTWKRKAHGSEWMLQENIKAFLASEQRQGTFHTLKGIGGARKAAAQVCGRRAETAIHTYVSECNDLRADAMGVASDACVKITKLDGAHRAELDAYEAKQAQWAWLQHAAQGVLDRQGRKSSERLPEAPALQTQLRRLGSTKLQHLLKRSFAPHEPLAQHDGQGTNDADGAGPSTASAAAGVGAGGQPGCTDGAIVLSSDSD